MDDLSTLHALGAFRPKTSAIRLQTLLRVAGTPEAGWNASDALLEAAGFTPETREAFSAHRQTWDAEKEARRLRENGIAVVAEADFPPLLRRIYDPPLVLFVRGELPKETVAVAIVGSRKASPYGRSVTHALVRPLAARGLTIVSGLAYGIDAEAHRGTLAVQGRTIAVLGSGVDDAALYPRAHRSLAAEIVANGGAVASEFPPGTGARPEQFPQRNRIIAGVSQAVVVIEASETSGALITARLALEENREVLAVPGPITSPLSAGTHRLLKEGAALASSAEDVLEALALHDVLALPRTTPETAPTTAGLAPAAGAPTQAPLEAGLLTGQAAHRILGLLTLEPQAIDTVIAASTLPPHEASAALSLLELHGLARDVGGKMYVRV